MSDSSTHILFNSPALHSLKRQQLLKLCKVHSVKAKGKNADLIKRLEEHAQEMPQTALMDPAILQAQQMIYSDVGEMSMMEEDTMMADVTRDEQWEMVTDDIPHNSEVTMSSKKRLQSANVGREPGTPVPATSTPRVPSSLRIKTKQIPAPALGTNPVHLEGSQFLIARQAPAPEDNSNISFSAPVPGSSTRLGTPAPADALLGSGKGKKTTIRLISHDTDHAPSPPQLAPFKTTFDSALGSSSSHTPPASKIKVWPASPTQGERLYPSIPYEDIQSLQSFVVPKSAEVKGRNGGVSADKGLDMPGSLTSPANKPSPTDQSQPKAVTTTSTALAGTSNVLSPALKPNTSPSKKETLGIPRSQPFIFGSPLSKHSPSNKDFGKAAASVLEEMKKRLAEQKAQKGASEQKPFMERIARSRAVVEQGQQAGSTDRFAKVHEQTFSKMAPITSHYAARRVMLPESKKRDLATLGAGSAPGMHKKNDSVANVLAMHGSGAKGDEDAGDRRLSKRMRITDATDVHEGKSISLELDAGPADTRQKQRERDAIRRKVDTRRRSSWDKTSPGRKAIMAKSSRTGLFATAKSVVRNVLSRGTASSGTSNSGPRTNADPSTAKPPFALKPTTGARAATWTASQRTGMVSDASKHSLKAHTSVSQALTRERKAQEPVHGTKEVTKRTNAGIRSATAAPSVSASEGTVKSQTRTSSRPNIQPTTDMLASRAFSGVASVRGIPSAGSKSSLGSGSRVPVPSLNGKRNMLCKLPIPKPAMTEIGAAENGTSGAGDRNRSSSLMAPTASSLARMQGAVNAGGKSSSSSLASVKEQPAKKLQAKKPSPSLSSKAALDVITNSTKRQPATRIFVRPLTAATFTASGGMATSVRNSSLAEAAKAAPGTPSAIPHLASPLKPPMSGTAQKSKTPLHTSTRKLSSMSPRKTFGGLKAGTGVEMLNSAKKKARQSEFARRKSRVGADGQPSVGMEIDT